MAEDHDRQHEHDPGHDQGEHETKDVLGHVHFEFRDDPAALAGEQADPARRSLSDALRVSFRLLSVMMVLVIVGLLLTGMRQIHAGQRGIRLTFGAVNGEGDDRVLGEGFRWSWPEPIGRVVILPTQEQALQIDDFWFYETAEEIKYQPDYRKRMVTSPGLRTGMDGALLTADHGLIHLKITCKYTFKQRNDQPDPQAILDYYHNIGDSQDTIRSAICSAAIAAAATRTAESIYASKGRDFADAVAVLAQQRLDAMNSGLKLTHVLVPSPTVPLAAIAAFDAVTSAQTQAENEIKEARKQAVSALGSAAGDAAVTLAGDVNIPGSTGLLQQYARAREQKREDQAEAILQQIYAVLADLGQTKGEARRVLDEANAYKQSIAQTIAARATRFNQLLGQYNATPEYMLDALWNQTRADILSSKLIEKYFVAPGSKTNLMINQDPEVLKRILTERMTASAEQKPK
jgi:membrane protease subunit HflK